MIFNQKFTNTFDDCHYFRAAWDIHYFFGVVPFIIALKVLKFHSPVYSSELLVIYVSLCHNISFVVWFCRISIVQLLWILLLCCRDIPELSWRRVYTYWRTYESISFFVLILYMLACICHIIFLLMTLDVCNT